MGKVVGLGGVFFRCADPDAMRTWYHENLGIPNSPYGATFKPEDIPKGGYNVWSPFAPDSDYLGPNKQPVMFNLMVDDVADCLKQVEAGGATGVRGPEVSEYGGFGWFIDPEGRQVELWQPPAALPEDVQ